MARVVLGFQGALAFGAVGAVGAEVGEAVEPEGDWGGEVAAHLFPFVCVPWLILLVSFL